MPKARPLLKYGRLKYKWHFFIISILLHSFINGIDAFAIRVATLVKYVKSQLNRMKR